MTYLWNLEKIKGNKMAEMTKGMNVHVIEYDGGINRSIKFKIRSIGKKQAILDRIIDTDDIHYGRRMGTSFYLSNREEAEQRYGRDIPGYIKLCWLQHFVPAGDDDWDLDENY